MRINSSSSIPRLGRFRNFLLLILLSGVGFCVLLYHLVVIRCLGNASVKRLPYCVRSYVLDLRHYHLKQRFLKLKPGMSKDEIISVMGRPAQVGKRERSRLGRKPSNPLVWEYGVGCSEHDWCLITFDRSDCLKEAYIDDFALRRDGEVVEESWLKPYSSPSLIVGSYWVPVSNKYVREYVAANYSDEKMLILHYKEVGPERRRKAIRRQKGELQKCFEG